MVVFRDHFHIVCAERDVVIKPRPAFTIEETWAPSTRRSRDCGRAFSIQATRWQRLLLAVSLGLGTREPGHRATARHLRVASTARHSQPLAVLNWMVSFVGVISIMAGSMGLVRSRGQQIIKTGEHGAASDVM